MRFCHDRIGRRYPEPSARSALLRAAQGVKIMRLDENDKVVGVAIVNPESDVGEGSNRSLTSAAV